MTRESEYKESQDSSWYTGASLPHIDWYKDGPRATTASEGPTDGVGVWLPDEYGPWHFLGPDIKDEVKEAIRIEPLKQGFLVKCRCVAERAFTDRVDAAEWLLGWLGFNAARVIGVRDVLAGLWDFVEPDSDNEWDADELYNILSDCVAGVDYDELGDRDAHSQYAHCMDWPTKWWEEVKDDHERALGVARAAQAYVEHVESNAWDPLPSIYNRLAEAVKKWRGIDSEDPRVRDARISPLDVASMEGG